MKVTRAAAATFVAVGFAYVTFVFLVAEPRMGFATLADYFDPDKVFPATRSAWWIVGELFYLGFGLAWAQLAVTSDDTYFRVAGLAAALGFVLIACLGRTAAAIPTLIEALDTRNAAAQGLLAVRLGVLKMAVFCLGVTAWRSTRAQVGHATGGVAWQGFGLLVLAASTIFVFVFVFAPVPLVFTVWATWYAYRLARAASSPGPARE